MSILKSEKNLCDQLIINLGNIKASLLRQRPNNNKINLYKNHNIVKGAILSISCVYENKAFLDKWVHQDSISCWIKIQNSVLGT